MQISVLISRNVIRLNGKHILVIERYIIITVFLCLFFALDKRYLVPILLLSVGMITNNYLLSLTLISLMHELFLLIHQRICRFDNFKAAVTVLYIT